MIERQHLAILREVDRRGSITAAAKHLHLTQPALSHAMKKLEGQLGVALWDRDGRGVRLTQAGQYLLSVATRLLPQLEHADEVLQQMGRGERGVVRIGMECHPCTRWLVRVVEPYLAACPQVDVDVRQQFQFGGIGALFSHEIDLLITPDPLDRPGLKFEPVFAYEQVLVVAASSPLASKPYVKPEDLSDQVLLVYPVSTDRLDIFTHFLGPSNCSPKRLHTMEATDIMLQMVAAGRGVAALPGWLVEEYRERVAVRPVRLGKNGLKKQIFVGMRKQDGRIDYIAAFLRLARKSGHSPPTTPRGQ